MKNTLSKKLFLIFLLAISSSFALAQDENVLIRNEEFSPTHSNRYSFMLGLNPSLTNSADITNFTFSYGKKLENFWLDTNILITSGLFDELSANNFSATHATDAQLIDQKNKLTTIGIGIGRESQYIGTIIPLDDIYEYSAANLTYTSYKEGFAGESFSGPGLLAKFVASKKINNYFSAGAHFNYNLAVVKRSAENDRETSSQRSLTIGYLTVGIDLSFFL